MPSEYRGGWRRGGPWGGSGPGWGARRRPPWWPQDEAWPPQDPEAWRGLRRRFVRRAAFFAVGVVLMLVFVIAAVIWLLTTLLGQQWIALVLGLGISLLLVLVARRVVRGVRLAAAPLGELIEASARVEAGEVGTQVDVRGPREVRALAGAFNAMSARLAEDLEQRRRLLADVSHELRTPLTVIQGSVEGMLDGLYPADRQQLERLLVETRQLERMIEDLRTLALADAGALPLYREPTDLGALAADVVAGFEPQAVTDGVAVVVETDAAGTVDVDPLRARQVIANLVSNALRHTPAGGRVAVRVTRSDTDVVLEVSDTGSGMDADTAARAFDRFWRAGDKAGAGLGLAIVRDLVRAHGGEAELENEPGMGTTVRCRFPS